MCGIAGIINFNTGDKVDQDVLELMTDAIKHRGPDDEGFYFDNSVGFGHRRLSIIDIEGGHQPMTNEDETIWIVYNGEIYNYLELRRDLAGKGHKFKTHSDTEVIIHLYEEYNEKCLERLNGMFAFALWDKTKKRLFAARDRLGIKPFYYYFDETKFIFASEIKAILKHPDIKAEPNWNGILDYLTFQFCLGDKTLFNGIKKLLPGHYLVLHPQDPGNNLSIHKYWDLDFTIDTYHTEDFFNDKLLRLVEDSVRLRLRSDVPLGANLRGGLDSSTITFIASSLLDSDSALKTFTGGFREGSDYDETDYAKIVSKFANTEYFEIYPTASDFIETLPKLIYYLDEPVAGPGVFPQYFVSKLASENVKVVLGGQGGDEIFGGYARYLVGYLEQCLKGAIFETQEEGKYVVTLDSIIPNLTLLQQYKPMLQYFWSNGLFEPMDRRYFKLIDRSNGLENLITEDLLKMRKNYSVFDSFQQILNNPNTSSYLNKMTHFDIKTLLPALLQVEDRTSMAVSLESRVPLLDHRIVELIASMPPTMKFRGGATKYIFKRAIRNVVPKEVLDRKDKMGFPVPLSEWYQDSLKGFLQEILLSDRAKERGIYNMNSIESAIATERKFGRQVWGLLCLELWFREFID